MALCATTNAEMAMAVMALFAGRSALLTSAMTELIVVSLTHTVAVLATPAETSVIITLVHMA